MKLGELKRSLAEDGLQRCYLLTGEDGYIRNQAYAAIRSAVKLEYEELNLSTFFGDTVVTGELVSALASLPFLSPKRLVAAGEYYPKAEDALKLEKGFFSQQNDTTVFVVMNAKRTDSFKKLAKHIVAVDCSHPEPGEAARWITKRLSMSGLAVKDVNAMLIAEYCLSDMARIAVECDKLISYCAGKAEVERSDIDACVVKESEYEIYEMTGAIAARDRTRAFKILESLLAQKQNEQLLLMALYSHFRRMLFAAIGKTSQGELAGMLGVKEYAVKKAAEQARLFTPKSLKAAVDRIADADYLNKSGGMNAVTALRYVVLELINS